jgi:hypothetical protein
VPRLKKAARNTIYTILTNKTYIGIKVINKHNGSRTEEVPAVWEPIIEEETFNRVQDALKKNRTRTPTHAADGRYVYLFSGLFRGELYVEHEIAELEGMRKESGDLFAEYRQPIQELLAKTENADNDRPSTTADVKPTLRALLSSLILAEEGIKIALSGSVNRKTLRSRLFVVAPPV